MISIHEKTLNDLEFFSVLSQINDHAITALGKQAVLTILPFQDTAKIKLELAYVNEYLSSFDNDNRIPNHGFDTISKELKLLKIENTYLEVTSLQKLVSISLTANSILKFLEKFKEYYPKLYANRQHIEQVDAVVDRFGDIKDDASPLLSELRKTINKLKGKINSSFASALTKYHNLEYLDDIRESVVENKRVLAEK